VAIDIRCAAFDQLEKMAGKLLISCISLILAVYPSCYVGFVVFVMCK